MAGVIEIGYGPVSEVMFAVLLFLHFSLLFIVLLPDGECLLPFLVLYPLLDFQRVLDQRGTQLRDLVLSGIQIALLCGQIFAEIADLVSPDRNAGQDQ
jgi:hypothetical protein